MKTFYALLVFALLVSGCTNQNEIDGIFVDFKKIEIVKKHIQQKDKNFLPAYEALIKKADLALTEGTFSVMDKKRTPPSGDKHDYLSMGPYWWPDTTKTDGLPYIRKDGEIKTETRGKYVDRPSAGKLFSNVETLDWAFYFSGEKKYAEKTVQLLETWFINPETRMNPNLNFAQGIPGICDGRGIGIIDWSGSIKMFSTIQILDAKNKFSPKTKERLFAWFEEYHDWLLNSEYGKFEDNTLNNQSTWYDVQVVGIEMMLSKTEMAKTRLENAKTKRIATQIEPDGSQPLELARTKSLGYSTMNLRGFLHLANLGQKLNVDLWNFETEDGRSIKKALDYVLPFAEGEKSWEFHQLGDIEEAIENLKIDFLMAAAAINVENFNKVVRTIKVPEKNLEIFLYPLFSVNNN